MTETNELITEPQDYIVVTFECDKCGPITFHHHGEENDLDVLGIMIDVHERLH